jgi:hypothetical protein
MSQISFYRDKLGLKVKWPQGVQDQILKKGVKLGEVRSPAPGVVVCDGVDPGGNKFSIESRKK